MSEDHDAGFQKAYWNEDGGRMWVDNMQRTHALIGPLGDEAVRRAAPRPGDRVLDVGCGGGPTSIQIAQLVGPDGRVVGVDISEVILRHARSQPDLPANLEFRLADAGSEDLGDARFDLVFSRFGVMFFADPVAAFTNLRRSLKPGGRLAFLCWQAAARNPWLAVPTRAIFEIMPPTQAPADPRAPGPFSFAEDGWVREILDAAGFSAITIEALEMPIRMGALGEASDTMMRLGPAAQALAEADETQRARAREAIEAGYEPFVVDGVVQAPSATWMVTARRD